ncbi:MAG: hypothetical protein U5N58_12110 [Actinomycetota bacterium]|nr:hypothetical protein [Actinomycetota bacterium]
MVNIEEKYSYGGWQNCIKMENDEIELICTTDVGPRIVRFGFRGNQNMFKEFKPEQAKPEDSNGEVTAGTGSGTARRLNHAPTIQTMKKLIMRLKIRR